jgi:pimeloyl-ACP methyl ester carboxylesterase
MRKHVSTFSLSTFGLLVIAMTFASHALAQEDPIQANLNQPTCVPASVPVGITDGGPKPYTISGKLCYQGNEIPSVVQLLVHGATYDHLYWDFPYNNSYYSYSRLATQVGYATFAIDRLGDGASSHPSNSLIDVNAGAVALHDVVQALRNGTVAGHSFTKVIWVGHSFGSLYGWLEVSKYQDVDGVIITGALHKISPTFLNAAVADIYPASGDPKFAALGLDSGYLTTVPGTRGTLFYYLPGADPNVIATDEANKDLTTSSEFSTGVTEWALPASQSPSLQIHVPVLDVIGQEDNLFCQPDATDCSSVQSVESAEASYYSPDAHLQVVIIPLAGHDINLHYTAAAFYAAAIAWSKSLFPPVP